METNYKSRNLPLLCKYEFLVSESHTNSMHCPGIGFLSPSQLPTAVLTFFICYHRKDTVHKLISVKSCQLSWLKASNPFCTLLFKTQHNPFSLYFVVFSATFALLNSQIRLNKSLFRTKCQKLLTGIHHYRNKIICTHYKVTMTE